ncbi:MAG: hypothetical protein CVU63_10155 [Deltaproteobacteria bacterium HGW-Deltaproteobacteria-20]|jgi:hypothetical protein|nr:MAG: hypothetical protein CVU63_10155 [Deltaproteobacteria bacterium HGW-Deltaproteobacteria-20]
MAVPHAQVVEDRSSSGRWRAIASTLAVAALSAPGCSLLLGLEDTEETVDASTDTADATTDEPETVVDAPTTEGFEGCSLGGVPPPCMTCITQVCPDDCVMCQGSEACELDVLCVVECSSDPCLCNDAGPAGPLVACMLSECFAECFSEGVAPLDR